MISIIIPTYNRANELKHCLECCLNQSYKNIEVIISDDGSTDNTEEIANSFQDSRIIYIKDKNSGLPSVARNKALKIAKGEWIAFCDSDDYWLENKLQIQMKLLEKIKAKACCTNASLNTQNDFFHQPNKQILKTWDLLKSNQVICSSLIVHKDLLEKSGSFSQNKEFRAYEDYELWLRFSCFSPILYIEDPLLTYSTSSDSIRLNDYEKDDRKRLLVYNSFLDFCFSKHLITNFFLAFIFVLKMKFKIFWRYR